LSAMAAASLCTSALSWIDTYPSSSPSSSST
jgi:hypothetical protein